MEGKVNLAFKKKKERLWTSETICLNIFRVSKWKFICREEKLSSEKAPDLLTYELVIVFMASQF